MTIQLTRREALDRSLAFLFCAIFVAMVGPFDWIIGATFIDAQMRHQSFRKEARHEVAANTSDAPTGDNRFQRNDAEGTREASVPKAINREAGADPQADRATPCRAIPSPVSEGSERSDLRVILPTSGAAQVGGSHGVRRVPEPVQVSWLTEAAQGLARSSSGIRGEALMVSAQGEASPKDSKALRIAGTGLDTGGRGHEARNIPFRSGWADQKRDGVEPEVHAIASTRGVSGGAPLRALAASAADLCGVPVDLFAALIARESSWNPEALSSSGAVGLAQVKPSTARGVSATLDVYKPFDNLLLGACYLRQQFDRFGSWRKALHAYHAGPTAVDDNAVPAASVRYAAQIGAASR